MTQLARPGTGPWIGRRSQRGPGHCAVSLKRGRELLRYWFGVRTGPAQNVITDRCPGEQRGEQEVRPTRGAIYLAALPSQLELRTSSGCVPVNAVAAVGSLRSWYASQAVG